MTDVSRFAPSRLCERFSYGRNITNEFAGQRGPFTHELAPVSFAPGYDCKDRCSVAGSRDHFHMFHHASLDTISDGTKVTAYNLSRRPSPAFCAVTATA